MPFYTNNYFYIITIALQGFCVWHCLRGGRQNNNWIWLIVFLPIIGCLIYFFSEIVTSREIEKVQSDVGSVLNPNRRIRRLEENLKVSDAFHNKMALADAYLEMGQAARAIELYESGLQGNFEENEHAINQLIIAYAQVGGYAEILPLAKKIYKRPQFARSKAHILYAMALEKTGDAEASESEFKLMKARFSNFEARYQYGMFLLRQNRANEAKQLFEQIAGEYSHLSPPERNYNRPWVTQAKEQIRQLKIKTAAS